MTLSGPEFLAIMRQQVKQEGTRAFAGRVGINPATISQVVNGHLVPTEAIAKAFGFIRVTSFVKIAAGGK